MKLLRLLALSLLGCAGLVRAEPTRLTHTSPTVDLPGKTKPTPASADSVAAPEPEAKLTEQFDRDGDGRLDATERQAARDFLHAHPTPTAAATGVRPGQAPPQLLGLEPVRPGGKIAPTSATSFPGRPLYDGKTLRTIFLDFDDHDWEQELIDFAPTDVIVPARLTMDGSTYADVGVHLSNRPGEALLPPGHKRSLDLTMDYAHPGQTAAGHRQIRLLASTTDPTLLRTVLYRRVAGENLPTPGANYVRVVLNGENWGVHINAEPLDDVFVRENFHAEGGAWWIVSRGANLAWLGDQPEAYRASYHLQSAEDPGAWAALIKLCRTITQAASGEFAAQISPLLDVEGALEFFSLENALINQDGYASPNGGFGLYLDPQGIFHLVPLDAEASFRLVQVRDYERPTARSADEGSAAARGEQLAEAYIRQRKLENTPHEASTNLAMLLSYSFVNKADSDFDEKLTKEEWHNFARSWFIVMDEDVTGRLARDQFIAKVRLVVTPPSVIDGHSQQSYGHEDPAGQIGTDFFNAMDTNHDDRVTQDEMVDAFDRWFAEWSDPKTARLNQKLLQAGFTKLFTQSVFTADESYIKPPAASRTDAREDETRGGGRRRGRGGRDGGGGGGSGLNIGPLHLGGRGGRNEDTRTLVTFSEELDPLEGEHNAAKPLLSRLLAVPVWRNHYLQDVDALVENWLTWDKLGPVAKLYHDLIDDDVAHDTHKAASYEHFVQEFDQPASTEPREGGAEASLKAFVNERGSYLRKSGALNGSDGE